MAFEMFGTALRGRHGSMLTRQNKIAVVSTPQECDRQVRIRVALTPGGRFAVSGPSDSHHDLPELPALLGERWGHPPSRQR